MDMKLKQLSLIIPNEPGALAHTCEVLKKHKINITTLTLADTRDFGILRLITENWEETKKAMESEGLVVKVTDVIAISIPDQVGGLLSILTILNKAHINVEYMYGFSIQDGANSVQVFRLNDIERGVQALTEAHIGIVGTAKLFKKK